MSITNEFNYYVNHTKKYPRAIYNAVDKIISQSSNPNNCFIENYDFDQIAKDIFTSLPRVVYAAESYPCITEKDIVYKNDEITLVLKEILNTLIKEFENRNYSIKGIEGVGLESGGLNFKKRH